MKKIIAISLLLIFGCSKDDGSSEVEVEIIIPGIEIVGAHTLFSYNDGSTDEINVGNLRFDSDFKGEYEIDYIRGSLLGQETIYYNKYFDWSFDGVFWNIINEDDVGFKVRLLPNGLYKLTRVDGYSVALLSNGVYFR
tara:strand:- start:51 stop:464 length:414 start_codon:yes stop_codon:yes gene_type:complete